MPALETHWTNSSKAQFDSLRNRAKSAGRLPDFVATHNEIAQILKDVEKAIDRSDPIFNTKKPGGVCHHFLIGFISVTFVLFEHERVAWITKYLPVPPSWPAKDFAGEQNGKHE